LAQAEKKAEAHSSRHLIQTNRKNMTFGRKQKLGKEIFVMKKQ